MSSHLHTKKIAGVCNFLMLCFVICLVVGLYLDFSLQYAYAFLSIVGLGALVVSTYYYNYICFLIMLDVSCILLQTQTTKTQSECMETTTRFGRQEEATARRLYIIAQTVLYFYWV